MQVKSTIKNSIIEINSSQDIVNKVKKMVKDLETAIELSYILFLNNSITFTTLVKTISEYKSIFLATYNLKESEICCICGEFENTTIMPNKNNQMMICEFCYEKQLMEVI
jgi:hypothetical protein